MSKETKDKTISIRLTSETLNQLNVCAKTEEKDRTEVIREAIDYYHSSVTFLNSDEFPSLQATIPKERIRV